MEKQIEELSDVSTSDLLQSKLVVHNDEFNSFEWVIECFIKYLKHESTQAEQCARLIDSIGKYSVKNGSYEELLLYKVALIDAGLSVTIE